MKRRSRIRFLLLVGALGLVGLLACGGPSSTVEKQGEFDKAVERFVAGDYRGTISRMEKDMPHWEMHPSGDELLVALSGEFEVLLQDGRSDRSVPLAAGKAFLVPYGMWHRLKVKTAGEVVFVTPGKGTQHRPL